LTKERSQFAKYRHAWEVSGRQDKADAEKGTVKKEGEAEAARGGGVRAAEKREESHQ
jgi:hypothetical protein